MTAPVAFWAGFCAAVVTQAVVLMVIALIGKRRERRSDRAFEEWRAALGEKGAAQ